MSADHRVQYDSKAPYVGLEVRGFELHDLRSHESARSSALDNEFFGFQEGSKSEVADLNSWSFCGVAEKDV